MGLDTPLHRLQDDPEPPVQGQEVGLSEDGAELIFQQRLPHHVAESVVGLGQQLQVQERFLLYPGRTESEEARK